MLNGSSGMPEEEKESSHPLESLPLPEDPPLPGPKPPEDPSEVRKKTSKIPETVKVLVTQLNRSIDEFNEALSSTGGEEGSEKGISGLMKSLGESIENMSEEERRKTMELIRGKTKEKLEE